jgi:hypothetical protein
MTPARATLLFLLAGSLGCSVGTTARNFQPAQQPRGIDARLRLTGSSRTVPVELLALQDSALIAVRWPENARPELVLIPLLIIEKAECPAVHSGGLVSNGAYSSPEVRARITHLARYPQGVSPTLFALLLGDYGQTAPAGLEGSGR